MSNSLQAPLVILELRPSQIDKGGVGVFAVRNLAGKKKVADGIAEQDFGSVFPWSQCQAFDAELKRKIMAFCVGTPAGFLPPPEFDFNKLSIEWYLNHSCEGNCGFDEHGDFVAIREIRKGEELCYDYALAESNPQFSMPCNCGQSGCRHLITGNDWKDERFYLKNREHMHPFLRKLLPIPV